MTIKYWIYFADISNPGNPVGIQHVKKWNEFLNAYTMNIKYKSCCYICTDMIMCGVVDLWCFY